MEMLPGTVTVFCAGLIQRCTCRKAALNTVYIVATINRHAQLINSMVSRLLKEYFLALLQAFNISQNTHISPAVRIM